MSEDKVPEYKRGHPSLSGCPHSVFRRRSCRSTEVAPPALGRNHGVLLLVPQLPLQPELQLQLHLLSVL